MIVAGAASLGWAVLVWRWQDPFTAVYTMWQQRELSTQLDRQIAQFAPPKREPGASLATVRRDVARAAGRYRSSVARGEAIGRLRIPRMGVDVVVVSGTDHHSLQRGPGHYRLSRLPGQGHLVYVAGHRTTYGAPFSKIESLRKGDRVTFELPYATFEYRVTGHRIVTADATRVLRSQGREVLALQACHPRFFASHRFIAYAKVVRVVPRGGDAFAPTARVAAAAS